METHYHFWLYRRAEYGTIRSMERDDVVYPSRRRANYALSDGRMYWNAGQVLQCVDGAFCQPMPEEMVNRGMPFVPKYVATEQLADQARSIRPPPNGSRPCNNGKSWTQSAGSGTGSWRRPSSGSSRPQLTPRSPRFALRHTPERRKPRAGTPADGFRPRRRKLPDLPGKLTSPLAGRGLHGVVSSYHSSLRAKFTAKCSTCDQAADSGAYCSSCAADVMARALDPLRGGGNFSNASRGDVFLCR